MEHLFTLDISFSDVNSCNQLVTAVIHIAIAETLCQAFYDKTCLAKCFGNRLEMHFEYLHNSVAQKLTELQFFGCQGYSRVNFEKLGTLYSYSSCLIEV